MESRVISEHEPNANGHRSRLVEITTPDGWMLVAEMVGPANSKPGWRWALDVTYNGTRVSVGEVRKTQRAAERELERWKKRLVQEEWL